MTFSKAVSDQDRAIMRGLAEEWARIADLPINEINKAEWKRHNSLRSGKPMVFIREFPMNELKDEPELQILTTDPRLQGHEFNMRLQLYIWKHMRGDMVMEKKYPVHYAISSTGFGISIEENTIYAEGQGSIASHQYIPVIREEKDIEKIQTPKISMDWDATEAHYQFMKDLFGDILPVVKRGAMGFWCCPWDYLVMWWGVQNAMMDLIMRPEMVHAAMDRLVSAYIGMLDQYEALGLLALNNCNNEHGGVGSGAHGWTDELPQPDFNPAHIRPIDMWGNCLAQIFSEVSPEMHEEFALSHERRWLERFGLNSYGCCEPLHRKIHILKSIPRLRRVSMSPWINVDEAVANMGNQFVFSYKPSPAILATDVFNPVNAEEILRDVLTKTKEGGCIVELTMKDISTCRHDPKRMWEWTDIATRVAEEFA